MKISITSEPPKNWDKYVLENDGSVYQTVSFAKFFWPDGANWIYITEKEKLVAGMLFTIYYNDGLRISHILPKFLYGTPFAKNNRLLKRLISVWQEVLKQFSIFAWMVVSFKKLPLPGEDELTCEIIPVKKYDKWFTEVEKDTRNQIRQAQRAGLTLDSFDYKKFCPLIKETNERHLLDEKDINYSNQWLEQEIQYGEKYGKNIGAYYQGNLIAGVVLYKFGKHAYLVKNASLNKYMKLRPNHLLYAEAIKWAGENDCVDLNTGGAEFDGLNHFKRSFGSKEFKYYIYSGKRF